MTALSAFRRAAAATVSRDTLWRDPVPLAADCGHVLRCLPIVEFRQTVICMRCGGLDVALSRDLTLNPADFTVSPEGCVTRRTGGV